MFLIDNPNLPQDPLPGTGGAPVAAITDAQSQGTGLIMWQVDPGAPVPGVAGELEPIITVVAGLPAPNDGVTVIPGTVTDAVAVVVGGEVFTLAKDAADPQEGELTLNPYTKKITLHSGDSDFQGLSAQVLGTPAERSVGTASDLPAASGGTTTIETSVTNAAAVLVNGQAFTPAQDPGNPQPGEFTQSPAGTVTLYSDQDFQGASAQVLGPPVQQIFYRTRILPPHPEWFSRFPLSGPININLAAEQQPTGSFQMNFRGRSNLLALLQIFKPDTLTPFYGYAFRVINSEYGQQKLSDQPYGVFDMRVSLGGSQERRLTEPVTVQQITDRFGSQDEISIAALAEVAGVPISTPAMTISLENRAAADELFLEEELRDRLRHLGLYVDYSGDAVEARNVDTVASWQYSDADLLEAPTIRYLGNHDQSPLDASVNFSARLDTPGPLPTSLPPEPDFGLVPEDSALVGELNVFPVTQITGTFSGDLPEEEQEPEELNGQSRREARPRWKRSIERVTLPKGDLNAAVPPADTISLKTVSLNYTASGPTKTLEWETSENGTPILTRTLTYGFVYLAKDTVSVAGGSATLNIQNPGAFWVLCREVVTNYIYDEATGYFLGTITTGRERHAFQAETDSLETYSLQTEISENGDPDGTLTQELRSYEINWRPIYEPRIRILEALSNQYPDIDQNEGKWVEFEYTGPDGQIYRGRERDPNFAPPYYLRAELTHRNSFESMPNWEEPEEAADGTLINPPPLTTGEESFIDRDVVVRPGRASNQTGRLRVTRGGAQPDRYTEFNSEMSASGPRYEDLVRRATFDDFLGRPGVSDRRQPSFASVEPETTDSSAAASPDNSDEFEYVVTSPGFNPSDPIREQQSYPFARTESEARQAVRTDAILAEITNPSRSINITVPVNLQIRPVDRVTVTLAGIIYQCRVNTISHSFEILGIVNGQLEIEGRSVLDLSPDREPTFTWTRRPRATETENGEPTQGGNLNARRLLPSLSVNLGADILTRRNFIT